VFATLVTNTMTRVMQYQPVEVELPFTAIPAEETPEPEQTEEPTPEATASVEPTPEVTPSVEPTVEVTPEVTDVPSVSPVFCLGRVDSNLSTRASVRSGPGLHYARKDQLAAGTQVIIVGISTPDSAGFYWIEVRINSGTAWIRADLMDLDDCLELQN